MLLRVEYPEGLAIIKLMSEVFYCPAFLSLNHKNPCHHSQGDKSLDVPVESKSLIKKLEEFTPKCAPSKLKGVSLVGLHRIYYAINLKAESRCTQPKLWY